MNGQGLSMLILEDIAARSMQDAGRSGAEGGGVLAGLDSPACCFHADQFDGVILNEGGEDAGGIGTASDARHDSIRQPTQLF